GPANERAAKNGRERARPVSLGESVQLLVQHHAQLPPGEVVRRPCLQETEVASLDRRPSSSLGSHLQRQSAGYAVQPAGQCFPFADGSGFAGQYEKRSLENVFSILPLMEH